ncbi:MFS transporter, partial [bacterium]|nr:MFS transporter [bacterium]
GTTCCGTNVTAGEPSGFMLSQAMATPAFWMFSLAICHMAVISSGLSLFNESVLNVQGFSTDAFYNLITLSGVAGLIAKLPVGWLGRQVSLARMQTVGLVLQAGCMLWLPHIHSASALTAYGIGMGVGGTISTVIFFSIWSQAFGARQLGRIQGFAQMLTVLASALGPRLLAECHAQTGDYRLAFEFLAIAGFLLGFGCWFVRVPRPEDAHSLNAATDDSSLLETVTP